MAIGLRLIAGRGEWIRVILRDIAFLGFDGRDVGTPWTGAGIVGVGMEGLEVR